jgi:integrase
MPGARRTARRSLARLRPGVHHPLQNPIEPRNFNRSFHARCASADVRRIRVHDTRHTCGSLLAALDVHPRVAMQILRHSKISITMEIYTEVPDASTREALRRLGESLG